MFAHILMILWCGDPTLQQHNQLLRIQACDLKLNKKKCQFWSDRDNIGDKLSAKGEEPDPAKVQALLYIPRRSVL